MGEALRVLGPKNFPVGRQSLTALMNLSYRGHWLLVIFQKESFSKKTHAAHNLNIKVILSQMLGLPFNGSEPFLCFAS